MRLFIAITLNDSCKTLLQNAQTPFRLNRRRGTFISYENFHLTLVFIGECDTKTTQTIETAIYEITAQPFEVSLGELGCFTRKSEEIWWVGLKSSSHLMALYKEICQILKENEIEFEEHKYIPHLTLVRNYLPADNHQPIILPRLEPITILVNAISLMKSERLHGELKYTEIMHVELVSP
jgi:RNA 2',3'-cyclic 3'-phosphodiesterase